MKDKKIITFKESHRGESYVAFTEDKTELYEFKIFIYLVNKEVIEIDGDEGVGNGYYGSGFWVSVTR